MKIVFYSNFMNHHQYGLCNELRRLGADLKFIESTPIPDEQKNLGYYTYDDDFILKDNENTHSQIYSLIMAADAVIFGSKPYDLFVDRVNSGRLTFNFSERLFKKSSLQALFAPINIKLKRKYVFNKKNSPYLLCAGSFVACDYKKLGYPTDKCLKWGYFPGYTEVEYEEIKSKKKNSSIIWVGRFISWKHPEYIVDLASYLNSKGLGFKIKMIGDGPLRSYIEKQIAEKELGDYIEITGPKTPDAVRNEFEMAEIAVITSDRNEGWGAVVNEAMGAGCAVVACDKIGSVSYLIDDGKNGLIYRNKKAFLHSVESLLLDDDRKESLEINAFKTIQNKWNYKTAAERLTMFIENRKTFENGPVSKG